MMMGDTNNKKGMTKEKPFLTLHKNQMGGIIYVRVYAFHMIITWERGEREVRARVEGLGRWGILFIILCPSTPNI